MIEKLVIKVKYLPNGIKLIYFKLHNKVRIIKNDIKRFKNNLTVKTHNETNIQLDLNYIKWPKNKNNFIIYKDGAIFCSLIEQIRDQRENFCKLLLAINEWNA